MHLIHAVDGAFPSDMAFGDDEGLEEEQRLFYVAVIGHTFWAGAAASLPALRNPSWPPGSTIWCAATTDPPS